MSHNMDRYRLGPEGSTHAALGYLQLTRCENRGVLVILRP